ncbi:MAG TPA: hypothetical protein VF608_02935 [Thermoanaerobaculia bacterium]
MKRFPLAVVCLLVSLVLAPSMLAQLTKVSVSRAQLTPVFGTARIADLDSPVWTSGTLRSRVYRATSGTPAAGLYVYEYSLDLRDVVGVTAIPFITSLSLDFGPVNAIDFNGDATAEHLFVVSKGLGIGNVAPATATKSANIVTFTFNPSVGGGSAPGNGDRTYVFGLVSKHAPRQIHATVQHNLGGAPLSLLVQAPDHR